MAKNRDFVNLTLQFRGFFLFIQPSQATVSTSNLSIKINNCTSSQTARPAQFTPYLKQKRAFSIRQKTKKSRPTRPPKNAKTKKLIKIKKTLDFSIA